MGMLFVLIFWAIVFVVLSLILGLITLPFSYFLCKRQRKRKMILSFLTPGVFIGIYAVSSFVCMIIIAIILGSDIGIGDSWSMPLKNGYELYKDYHYFEIRKISRRMDDRMSEDLLQFGTIKAVGAYRFLFGVEPSDSYMEAIPLPSNHPVYVRPRRDGDRILINGHHKKVSRLLINQKIPLDQRNNLVVLEQDKQILAIPEIAISDLSKELKNDIMRDTIYIQKIDR